MNPHFCLFKPFISCFPVLFLTYSCQLAGPYTPPAPLTPEQWKNETKEQEQEQVKQADVCEALGNWWKIFQDPVLNQLEEQAVQSSYTLQAALDRLIQADATARAAMAALYPNINFEPSYFSQGSLFNPQSFGAGSLGAGTAGAGQVGLGSSSQSSNPLNPINQIAQQARSPSLVRVHQLTYGLPLVLNYDLDLWDKLKNTYLSDVYLAEAKFEDYLNALLTLTTNVAYNYFILRGLDAEQAVLQRNIKSRQAALEINSARYEAGLIIYADVTRADLEVANALTDSAEVERRRLLQENILATLTGIPAPIFNVAYNPLVEIPPVIPPGFPSDLLLRRPDIATAERNMASAHAQIGVAYASFFPDVQITAAAGLQSPTLASLLTWKARFWQVAVNIMQTVFDAGRNDANLRYAKAAYRETVANYQQQVLQAFQEVEDALGNIRQYAVEAKDLIRAVKAANQTLELLQERYDQGLINYLDVVDAERSSLDTERNAVITLSQRYQWTVQLVRALGGAWKIYPLDNSEQVCEEEVSDRL